MGPCRVSENNDHPLARLQETWRLEQNMYKHLIEVGNALYHQGPKGFFQHH